jgi:leader peptidase (prepilin peptidase) / N-methyltransferase
MPPFLIAFLVFLLGILAGMFINYLAEALPYRRRLVRPFCVKCGLEQDLQNYLITPRRCPSCGTSRGVSTLVIELLFAALTLWLWFSPPEELGFLGGFALLIFFGVVVVIDMRYRLILKPVALAGAIIGLLVGWQLNGIVFTLLGGAAGYGAMYAFYFLGILFNRAAARMRNEVVDEDALGFGDVNLSGVLGLILGWPAILPALLLAILIGGLAAALILVFKLVTRRYHALMAIPYGPFLIASAVLLIYFRGFLQALLAP